MPGYLIRRCHQISVALFHDECRALNITPIQFAVLEILSEYRAMDQISLAGYAALNRSTTGEVVNRLEARGLVQRTEGAQDRRIKVARLTNAGEQLLFDVTNAVQRVQERILSPLTASEKTQFMRCLAKIATENNEHSRAPLRRT